jgi:hypothetical protein
MVTEIVVPEYARVSDSDEPGGRARFIIGLSGYAQCGKDAVAAYLVERYGFERRGFADKMREAVYALNPVVVLPRKRTTKLMPFVRVSDFVELYGAFAFITVGEIMSLCQRFTDEVGPRVLGMDLPDNVARKALVALDPIVVLPHKHWFAPSSRPVRINDFIAAYGYEQTKKMVPEFRALLQRMGTEVGRNLLGESVWADACLRHIPRLLVLSDTRSEAEARAIKSCGGLVVRVERPGYGPVNGHVSEVMLDKWDFDSTIRNDSTMAVLQSKVDALIAAVDIRGDIKELAKH